MYTITALSESSHLKPEGDCYAPQIVLTASRGRLENVTELNTESLPFDADELREVLEDYNWRFRGKDVDIDALVSRRFRIVYGIDVNHTSTHGYSQGDWGESFVFGTPEFYKVTGAPGLTDTDHNELCAWIWGDVYEVRTKAVTHIETCSLGHDHIITDEESELEYFIYGMDQAHKFANEHNIEIEGL